MGVFIHTLIRMPVYLITVNKKGPSWQEFYRSHHTHVCQGISLMSITCPLLTQWHPSMSSGFAPYSSLSLTGPLMTCSWKAGVTKPNFSVTLFFYFFRIIKILLILCHQYHRPAFELSVKSYTAPPRTVPVVVFSSLVMESTTTHRPTGLGYSYSVLVLAVLEYWIYGTHTVLVSSKVIVLILVLVLVDKYSGTRMSTDILWYICDVRVKTIIPVK